MGAVNCCSNAIAASSRQNAPTKSDNFQFLCVARSQRYNMGGVALGYSLINVEHFFSSATSVALIN